MNKCGWKRLGDGMTLSHSRRCIAFFCFFLIASVYFRGLSMSVQPAVVEAQSSSAAKDDAELAEFTSALTAPPASDDAFRSSVLWRAPIQKFEAKQRAPEFARDSWTRWLRLNRESARFDVVAEADKNRRFNRAAIVRPLVDGSLGRRKLPDVQCRTEPTLPQTSVARDSPPPPTMTPRNKLTAQRVPKLLDPIPITPRTYRRLAKLPAPDTHMEGIALVSSILDSHYRLRNIQEDDARVRRSFAFMAGRRLEVLQHECASRRQENLSAFLRLMQRIHTSERGPLEAAQLAQWYDGFVSCARLGSADSMSAAHAEAASIEHAFLGLASQNFSVESPPSLVEFLIAPVLERESAASEALLGADRTEVMLSIAALRATCAQRSVHLTTKSTWDGYHTDATFLECMHRQLPNTRHHLDNAVFQLMSAGVLPRPLWTTELQQRYVNCGPGTPPVAASKRWQLTTHAVQGAIGFLHIHDDPRVHRRSSSRGAKTPLGSERQRSVATPSRDSLNSTLHGKPSTPGAVQIIKPSAEVTAEGLSRLLRERSELLVEPAQEAEATGDVSPPEGRRSPPVASAALLLLGKYDLDGSGGLSPSEFLHCLWSEPTLHALGRW